MPRRPSGSTYTLEFRRRTGWDQAIGGGRPGGRDRRRQGQCHVWLWNLPDRCARKEDSKPAVWQLTGGQKRHVTLPAVLFALGHTWADVKTVLEGALIRSRPGHQSNFLTGGISPHPVQLNQPRTYVVAATDAGAGAPVAGDVLIDGTRVAVTNTRFTHSFRLKRIRVPDPSGGRPASSSSRPP